MTSEVFVIPEERLPPGFAAQIETPPDTPAPALPAATAVLVRDGEDGLEVLLLRRTRESGFVPGAYVFAGGRVDEGDAEAALSARAGTLPSHPPAEYWIAAVRELFEESGVLLAADAEGEPATDESALVGWRSALLEDERDFLDIVETAELRLCADRLVHCAHWITPAAEPRRFDTHFFLAGLPPGAQARADVREMTDARWVTPVSALAQFSAGELPMVFPTVKTIESLVGFDSVESALEAFRGRQVQSIQPRLVRTARGVGIVVDHDEGKSGA
jgi:recombination protein RecT